MKETKPVLNKDPEIMKVLEDHCVRFVDYLDTEYDRDNRDQGRLDKFYQEIFELAVESHFGRGFYEWFNSKI